MAQPAPQERKVEVRNIEDARLIEWVYLKVEKDRIERQQKDIRSTIIDTLHERADPDDKGNLIMPFAEPISGYSKMVYQKRVSRSLDSDSAEAVLKSLGLWERCAPPAPQVDLDEVFACRQEGLLTDEQLEEIYPAKESWAVVVRK